MSKQLRFDAIRKPLKAMDGFRERLLASCVFANSIKAQLLACTELFGRELLH